MNEMFFTFSIAFLFREREKQEKSECAPTKLRSFCRPGKKKARLSSSGRRKWKISSEKWFALLIEFAITIEGNRHENRIYNSTHFLIAFSWIDSAAFSACIRHLKLEISGKAIWIWFEKRGWDWGKRPINTKLMGDLLQCENSFCAAAAALLVFVPNDRKFSSVPCYRKYLHVRFVFHLVARCQLFAIHFPSPHRAFDFNPLPQVCKQQTWKALDGANVFVRRSSG